MRVRRPILLLVLCSVLGALVSEPIHAIAPDHAPIVWCVGGRCVVDDGPARVREGEDAEGSFDIVLLVGLQGYADCRKDAGGMTGNVVLITVFFTYARCADAEATIETIDHSLDLCRYEGKVRAESPRGTITGWGTYVDRCPTPSSS